MSVEHSAPVHHLTSIPRRAARSAIATLVGAAACAGRTPAPDATPAPVAAPAAERPVAATAGGATRFTWSAGERRVEVHTDALVTRDASTLAGAPAAAPDAEHVISTAYLTAVLAPSDAPGATSVQGTVDSLVVNASARVRGDAAAPNTTPSTTPVATPAATSTLLTGFRYRAASDARGVRVEPADPATDLHCTAPAAAASLGAIAAVREALPRIPAGLAAGVRWRDTTVSASCAGPVLLVAQTVARYESAADPAVPGRLRVTRQSTTTARGQGAAGVRPMSVVATGTARGVYALDPARGQLVDGTGEGRTTVTVTLGGVVQRFTQQTRTQLVVR
ncbi:hypothetical protein tb265_12320 [Gemmatimonadetes bacterium T265]|nr:hypothetical protein tb265_12320 [Gemmatimonadetes bacterium T265]